MFCRFALIAGVITTLTGLAVAGPGSLSNGRKELNMFLSFVEETTDGSRIPLKSESFEYFFRKDGLIISRGQAATDDHGHFQRTQAINIDADLTLTPDTLLEFEVRVRGRIEVIPAISQDTIPTNDKLSVFAKLVIGS